MVECRRWLVGIVGIGIGWGRGGMSIHPSIHMDGRERTLAHAYSIATGGDMTLKELRTALRILGCSLSVYDGELCVRMKGQTYFTDSRKDALDTARSMRGGRDLQLLFPEDG